MKAGKKERQTTFHKLACLLFASLQRLVLLAQRDMLSGFFPRTGKATTKHNNSIKEDIQ